VLGDREILEDRRFLVHGEDPEPVRGGRIGDRDGLAVDQHLAVVGGHDAGEDLDERRLPRAVLADERVNRGAVDREAALRDRMDWAVALRDPAQLEEGAHRGYAAVTPPSTLTMFPVDFSERGPAK